MGLDELTGLPGWMELRDAMQAVFTHRTGVGVGLLRVNIDGLAQISSEHGESSADDVLLGLVKLLRRMMLGRDGLLFRASDVAVLLPAASRDEALELAGEIGKATGAVRLPNGGSMTVSIGVGHATIRAGHDPAALLDIADSALRTAKHRGSNQVAIEAR
jgi:diguanylate cyclase (GGDEF)-like protein